MVIEDVVKETLRVVEECRVPESLKVIAFSKIFDVLTGPSQEAGGSPEGGTPSDDILGRIANRLAVHVEKVMAMFYEEGGELSLGISSSKLDPSIARATKQIALLVASARQASGLDEDWTSVDTIREICRDFKKLDPNNFAGTITEMDDVFNFRGKGKQRAVRVAQPGWAKAKQLFEQLSGGDKSAS